MYFIIIFLAFISFYLRSTLPCVCLPFSPIRYQSKIYYFFLHFIPHTIPASIFFWPSSTSPSIKIHTHHLCMIHYRFSIIWHNKVQSDTCMWYMYHFVMSHYKETIMNDPALGTQFSSWSKGITQGNRGQSGLISANLLDLRHGKFQSLFSSRKNSCWHDIIYILLA